MKVFISSVRAGLEAERDALRGLIQALGHEPLRFEDFTAQSIPSREACMDGVDNADVYLLILGPRYGYRFPDTNQSPTHDEFRRAQQRGIDKLVFITDEAEMEPEQREFLAHISEYGTGVFRKSFTDVADLQVQVAEALRDLASQPGTLTYEPLAGRVDVTWKSDWDDPRAGHSHVDPLVELHIVPVPARVITTRVMSSMAERLINSLREAELLKPHEGAAPATDATSATVTMTHERIGSHDALRPRQFLGVRIDSVGQVSTWWALPRDMMGGALNQEELADAIAQALHVTGIILGDGPERFALNVGVSGSMVSLVEGPLQVNGRRSATMNHFGGDSVQHVADETVSSSAFTTGAPEVALQLATSLINNFLRNR